MSVVAISVATGAGALAGLYGSKKQADAIEKGSKTQAASSDRAADMLMEQYEQTREDMSPWRTGGEQALYKLMGLQGLDMPYDVGQGHYYEELSKIDDDIYQAEQDLTGKLGMSDKEYNFWTASKEGRVGGKFGGAFKALAPQALSKKEEEISTEIDRLKKRKQFLQSRITPREAGGQDATLQMLQQSPDYQFALQEGLKATDLAMNKRGLLGSGRASKERMRYGSGLASQKLQDYRNSLAALSGTGQTTSAQIGQFGAGAAQGAGQATMAGGAARASGYQAKGQGYMNMANAVGGGLGDYAAFKYLMGT